MLIQYAYITEKSVKILQVVNIMINYKTSVRVG